MNINDNSALIKEFSERLPYDLYFSHCGKVHKLKSVELDGENTLNNKYPIEICYPYLRPMSSMTEDEMKTYRTLQDTACSYHFDNDVSLDYLNSIHIDYRGLIPMNLALEASEGMYDN